MATQPWLDGLSDISEEWPSIRASSPPTKSDTGPRVSSIDSQSRIPHLAHSMRLSSNGNGSFLKPRSQRGLARQKQEIALREASASSINSISSLPSQLVQTRRASTLPRRASSTFSNSQNSVQHHTIHKSYGAKQDTPEWKRRLNEGEDLTGDGFDLFSPSRLEGMFRHSSTAPQPPTDENDGSVVQDETKKPWTALSSSNFPLPVVNPYRSYKTQRGGRPDMDVLQEEDEDEDAIDDLSAISSDIVKRTSLRGLVKRRVSILEGQKRLYSGQDPRYRSMSGRREIQNEGISPVTVSTQNTIRTHALQDSLEHNPDALKKRLTEALMDQTNRPRSKSQSSDHDVSYEGKGSREESILCEELLEEMTSQSLPEDLSMGTQNYIPSNGFVNMTRGAGSGESSFMRKGLSSASTETPQLTNQRMFRSSPPPYRQADRSFQEESELNLHSQEQPIEDSVVHHATPLPPTSKGSSPLKLFGPRDTFTHNKLERIMSRYEDITEVQELDTEGVEKAEPLRMSNFGQGELDGFGFEQEVQRPTSEQQEMTEKSAGIFGRLANVHLDGLKQGPPQTAVPQQRSPKRRRTLVQDEVALGSLEIEVKVSQLSNNTLAGQKRKDAIPGTETEQASAETMATRHVRRPSGSRKSSAVDQSRVQSMNGTETTVVPAPPLAEALAAELESFAKTAAAQNQDSRRTSLATKDYMEEANKVMAFIRARGRPQVPIPEMGEPEEPSELDADHILDLELDDSTKDSFSRPPSREGYIKPKKNLRVVKHDSRIASHLQKFQESDDLELVSSASVVDGWQLGDNRAVDEAAQLQIPEADLMEVVNLGSDNKVPQSTSSEEDEMNVSDPPGMRILNDQDKKRKHSGTDEQPGSIGSSDGTGRTIQTNSSDSSRGMIISGTVSIPDTVGVMMFNKERNIWIKQKHKLTPLPLPVPVMSPTISRTGHQDISEADPFDDIPDLSIDEQEEEKRKRAPLGSARGNATDLTGKVVSLNDVDARKPTSLEIAEPPLMPMESSLKSPKTLETNSVERPSSRRTQAAQHEERLHDGIPSQDVLSDHVFRQQPRVVTIAFSSPIASEIPYHGPPSISDIDDDDPSMLPIDEDGSMLGSSPTRQIDSDLAMIAATPTVRKVSFIGSVERHGQYRAMTLNRRPVSRIQEHDEEQEDTQENNEMSLILASQNHGLAQRPEQAVVVKQDTARKQNSILCLTPLSDFTLHQAERMNHPEESYIAERANPNTLRQAHGSQMLAQEALVKAIQDAESTELYWDQLQKLCLANNGLTSVHSLEQYCASLRCLNLAQNKVTQLTGLPVSLRSVDLSSNMINNLAAWTHLHNLQVVDVSNNQLESLDCFASLVHLRKLRARHNRITHIGGIFDNDALVALDLTGNQLSRVDFADCELSSLEELNLSQNQLVHLHSLESLPALTKLDISSNAIRDFATDQALHLLEHLDLSCNQMSIIDLVTLPALRNLNLDNNVLTSIYNISCSSQLSILSARSQAVPSNLINQLLESCHDILELRLSANILPDAGLSLPSVPSYNLRTLELASCGIDHIPPHFGDYFPNLRDVNLNFNAIKDLSPLIGCIKLEKLSLARNRVQKLRRTCLTLGRLAELKIVDLRDNPLTVGFYAPRCHESDMRRVKDVDSDQLYELRDREVALDSKWMQLIDETTWLRRRAMELLLIECCPRLERLDGGQFDRGLILREQTIFERLMNRGVLQLSPKKPNTRQPVDSEKTESSRH